MTATRATVHYSGRVQGVGFRAAACGVARRYAVTGYVRNLPDRRVELVTEGERREVDRFLDEVAETMSGHIREATVDRSAATGEFAGFSIRY